MFKMTRYIFPISVILVLGGTAPAAASELESVIRNAAGREASFVQKFTPRGFKKEQVEHGKVVFGEAPRMRWTYAAPESKVFVFDGSTSWLYTPSERQVIVTRLSEQEKRQVPLAFLWDPAAGAQFAVRSEHRGRDKVLHLTPKAKDSQIRSAQVVIGGNGLIQSLSWTDRQGNRTAFEFRSFRKTSISAGTFRFAPPKGTDVVENRGGIS